VVAGPGPQPGGPATDDEIDLGARQAGLAGLLEGGVIVLGQPGQAGDREVVVTLVGAEGDAPLDEPLHLAFDGRPLRDSTGHGEDRSPPPDRPAPRSAGQRGPGVGP
jgi:hypothetical protein